MKKKLVLVISENEIQLEQLKKKLEANSFEVITAPDGKVGFELARKALPNLILSDIQLDKLDGIDLCFMIRQNFRLSSIPYILVADDLNPEVRINSYRSGIDAIVTSTISTRELCTRIETLMNRYEILMKQTLTPNQSMVGKLNDFRLIEVLQMLNLNQKTGKLNLYFQNWEGHIMVVDGNITFATLNGKSGEEAVQNMAFWEEGFFIFEKDAIQTERNINKPTMQLILDCCQILDESKPHADEKV